METRTETWRPVKGFEGFYEVSDLGNVRSLNYHNWGIVKNLTPVPDKDGYLRVCLSMNGRQYNRMVHRMVAMVFLDNPDNLPQINHINEDKTDNRVLQLDLAGNLIREWDSLHEVNRQLGFDVAHIGRVCNGLKKTGYGFKWQFAA